MMILSSTSFLMNRYVRFFIIFLLLYTCWLVLTLADFRASWYSEHAMEIFEGGFWDYLAHRRTAFFNQLFFFDLTFYDLDPKKLWFLAMFFLPALLMLITPVSRWLFPLTVFLMVAFLLVDLYILVQFPMGTGREYLEHFLMLLAHIYIPGPVIVVAALVPLVLPESKPPNKKPSNSD